jgi:hypothetical protein
LFQLSPTPASRHGPDVLHVPYPPYIVQTSD